MRCRVLCLWAGLLRGMVEKMFRVWLNVLERPIYVVVCS